MYVYMYAVACTVVCKCAPLIADAKVPFRFNPDAPGPSYCVYVYMHLFIHSYSLALWYLSVVWLNEIPSCPRPFIFNFLLVNKVLALNNKKKEKERREWTLTNGGDHVGGREGGHSVTQTLMKESGVLLRSWIVRTRSNLMKRFCMLLSSNQLFQWPLVMGVQTGLRWI